MTQHYIFSIKLRAEIKHKVFLTVKVDRTFNGRWERGKGRRKGDEPGESLKRLSML